MYRLTSVFLYLFFKLNDPVVQSEQQRFSFGFLQFTQVGQLDHFGGNNFVLVFWQVEVLLKAYLRLTYGLINCLDFGFAFGPVGFLVPLFGKQPPAENSARLQFTVKRT